MAVLDVDPSSRRRAPRVAGHDRSVFQQLEAVRIAAGEVPSRLPLK